MNVDTFLSMLGDFLDRDDLTDSQLLNFANLGHIALQRQLGFDYPRTRTTLSYTAGGISLPATWKGFPSARACTYIDASGTRFPLLLTRWANIAQRRKGTADTTDYCYTQELGGGTTFTISPDRTEGTVELVHSYWMTPLAAGGAEDPILRLGYDSLLLHAMAAYNLFSKEEEKVPLDASLVAAKTEDFILLLKGAEDAGAMIDR